MLLHCKTKQNRDMLDTKRMRFPIDVILVWICWYAAYPLSYHHLKEMMQELRRLCSNVIGQRHQNPRRCIGQCYSRC